MADVDTRREDTRQLLTFRLDDVTYALPIASVREIRGFGDVTPVPGAPAHVRGVMNLRGQVIPVTDLRLRFGLAERPVDRFTVIVLIEVEDRIVGAVVDSVSDVIDIDPSDTQPVPELGTAVDQACLDGMVTVDDDVVLTLCVEAVVGAVDSGDASTSSRRASDAA